MTLNIKNTTLVCIDTKNKIEALLAIEKSISNIRFQYYKFFTNDISDIKLSKFKNISDINLEIIEIGEIKSKKEYSKFCLIDLNEYINSKFCLTIQHDGYIINPQSWNNDFFEFDYIGAPWPIEWGYINRVGNGGFCLKSKYFLETTYNIFKDFNFEEIIDNTEHKILTNEDFLVCNIYYNEMINRNIKFADINTASLFSAERNVPELYDEPFGFHGDFIKIKNKF